MLQVLRSGGTVSRDFENEDEDVVQALQAAMIASQAGSDKKSVLKVRAASQSIDGESAAQSMGPSFYFVACHCTAVVAQLTGYASVPPLTRVRGLREQGGYRQRHLRCVAR